MTKASAAPRPSASISSQLGVPVKIARIFNTYGPRMLENDGRIISNFVVQALRGEPLTVYGDGSQTRSFCYIDGHDRGSDQTNAFAGGSDGADESGQPGRDLGPGGGQKGDRYDRFTLADRLPTSPG